MRNLKRKELEHCVRWLMEQAEAGAEAGADMTEALRVVFYPTLEELIDQDFYLLDDKTVVRRRDGQVMEGESVRINHWSCPVIHKNTLIHKLQEIGRDKDSDEPVSEAALLLASRGLILQSMSDN